MHSDLPQSSSEVRFDQERRRLLEALGELTAGGVVEASQHIGATSFPGSPPSACIDIALAVWPFPLEPQNQKRLESLGYHLVLEEPDRREQRFLHTERAFQVFIIEAGSKLWTDYRVLNDYLRNDPDALESYAAKKQDWAALQTLNSAELLESKAQFFEAMLDSAQRRWVQTYGFQPLQGVTNELKGLSCPWYVSSGWAIDLFLGCVNWVHEDIDIVVPMQDQFILQAYLADRGWKLLTPFDKRLSPWPVHMRIELPRFQVHAHREGAFIDFLLSDIQAGIWRYRRDPAILRAADRIGLRTPEGTPYLAPELVLLFKSKNTSDRERSKDAADFERAWPFLEPERRAWLRWALTATGPQHPWIERLA